MFFHMKQLEDESRNMAKKLLADVQEKHRRETSKIGRLLSLYGAVDGQKFGVERPTVKARHSRKYFGRGKGQVAYSL